MACLAGYVLMHARDQGLLHFDVAVLARGHSLYMAHAARAGLMAVNAFQLDSHMRVLRQTRRLGKFLPEIAIAAPAFHGTCMAHKGAPAAAGAVRRRRCPRERVASSLPRWRIVAVKTAGMADIARLLFGYCLLVREREIDLLHDLFGVLEGELIAFCPADWLGVRK